MVSRSMAEMQQPGKHLPELETAPRSERALELTLLASLSGSVLALVLFAWLAQVMVAGGSSRFDLQVRLWAHQFASPAMTSAMRLLSTVGSGVVLTGFSIVLVLIFIGLEWRRAGALLATAMGGAVVLDLTLKDLFPRPRPEPFFDLAAPHSYSFPSGHALASFCFFGVLAGLIMARVSARLARVIIWLAAALLVAAIGFSRVYLGVHYPTDVLAGYAAAAVWVSAVVAVDRYRRRRNGAPKIP